MAPGIEPLTVRLLGQFEVWRNGSRIYEDEWPRRQPKWLLALLLSRPGFVFSHDMLIESLIGGGDPDKARRNLYGVVNKLRRTLEPRLDRAAHSAFVLRRGEGYCFNPDAPYSLDTERFEALVEEGTMLKHRDQWGDAYRRYEQAVELYRGDFLQENRYDEWTLEPRDRLTDCYIRALEGLASCCAALGDFAAAIALSRRVTRYVPYSERSYRCRMRYHYCAGELDSAEETFRECVKMLREELETEPSPEILELRNQILAGRAPRIGRWIPSNLPQPIASFVGRTEEVADVSEIVRGNRLLTLVGAGGIGKTRLALEVGSRMMPEFTDGVWFVDLSTITDARHIAEKVTSAFDDEVGVNGSDEALLSERLCSKRLLLILDPCEHLGNHCARLVEKLLLACPELKVLSTSREPLGVPGEVQWDVPPLRVPDPSMSLEELEACDAIKLLLERVRSGLPQFGLSPENANLAVELCRELGGVPLAIELAASRAQTMPLDELVKQAAGVAMVQSWEMKQESPRHQSLEASICWSYEVLKAGEQRVFRHAAVFPGGFDLEAARGVLGDKSNPPSIISDRLSVLVERSLVEFDPTPGLERYRLLDTVRAFASLRLIEAGEDSSCRHRHMRYYAALADRAEVELHGPVQSHWLRRLDNELGNLRAAFAWALESGEIDAGLRLASLGRFWATRCRYEEGLEWLDEAIAQSDEVPGALRAAALRTRAWLLMHRRPDLHHDGEGDMERAREDSREASELYLQLGDRTEWARCRLLVGNAEFLAGRKDAAQTIYEEVLRVDREVGNRGGEAACLGNLSRIHLMRGNDEGALPLLEQALVIAREMGDLGKVQSSLRDMGNIHERRRDDLQAWKLWEEGLALAQETGDQQQELTMLVLLAIGTGSQAELAADPTASQGYWDRALQLASEIPTGAAELHVLTNYAEFLLRSGAYAKARSVLSRAVPLALDRGESLWGALGALLLAEIVCREGAAGQAMELLGAARAGSFDITSRPHMRELDAGIVELARESLSAERADALLEKGARTDLKTAVALALSQQAE